MKTKRILKAIKGFTFTVFILTVCTHFATAQVTETDRNVVPITVAYDAVAGTLTIPKPANQSWFFPAKKSIYANFKISNINPFYNSITVKGEQKSFVIDVPAKFLSILGDDKKADTSTTKPNNFAKSSNLIPKIKQPNKANTSFSSNLSTYLSNWVKFQKLVALNDFLDSQIKKQLTVDAISFKKGIKNNTISYLGLYCTNTVDVEKALSEQSSNTYKSLIIAYGGLKKEYENQSGKKPNSSLKSATNKKDGSITVSIVKDSITDNPYKEVFAYITTVYNKLLDDNTKNTYQQKIDKGIQLYQMIQNESFEIVSEPKLIEDESDYLDLTLNINNTDGKTLKTISPIRIYQSGGLKIDFSTGIAFGLAGAKDRSYSLQQPDTSSLVIRQNNNYNKFFPSVAAFIHVYGRNYYRSVLPALTFGISTNPAGLEQTSFYAGGSLMFRNSMLKRIIISGGLAAANVNYLKNTYQTDYTYTAKNFKNYTNLKALKDEDLVERKFRTGWFVSVSYNLSKK